MTDRIILAYPVVLNLREIIEIINAATNSIGFVNVWHIKEKKFSLSSSLKLILFCRSLLVAESFVSLIISPTLALYFKPSPGSLL